MVQKLVESPLLSIICNYGYVHDTIFVILSDSEGSYTPGLTTPLISESLNAKGCGVNRSKGDLYEI